MGMNYEAIKNSKSPWEEIYYYANKAQTIKTGSCWKEGSSMITFPAWGNYRNPTRPIYVRVGSSTFAFGRKAWTSFLRLSLTMPSKHTISRGEKRQ
jgi:hypothetical protein